MSTFLLLSLFAFLSLTDSCQRMAQNSDQKSWSTISGANMNNGVFIFPAPNSRQKKPHFMEMSMIIPKEKWPVIVIPLFPKSKSQYRPFFLCKEFRYSYSSTLVC